MSLAYKCASLFSSLALLSRINAPPPQYFLLPEWVIHAIQNSTKGGFLMDEITQLIFQAKADLKTCNSNNSNNGATLTQVMDNIRSKPYETSAMFDQCGRKIYEHTSHHHNYNITAIPPAYKPHLFLSVHNHPADSTFSSNDLETAVRLGLGAIIVATTSRNYVMLRPSTGWPTTKDWIDEYDDIAELLRRHPHHDYDAATARHLALMKVAAHYHLQYYVTDLKGKIITSTTSKLDCKTTPTSGS